LIKGIELAFLEYPNTPLVLPLKASHADQRFQKTPQVVLVRQTLPAK
jgi:hypothetical protein